MPLYLYKCQECGKKQEVRRRMEEVDDEVWCPKCGNQMTNIPAVPSRMVRGSGSWSSPA